MELDFMRHKNNDQEPVSDNNTETFSDIERVEIAPDVDETIVEVDQIKTEDEDRIDNAVDALSLALDAELKDELDGGIVDHSNTSSIIDQSSRLAELGRQHEFIAQMGTEVLQYEMMLHDLHSKLNNVTKFISSTRSEFKDLDRIEAGNSEMKTEIDLMRRQLQETRQTVAIQTARIKEQDFEKTESRKILEQARKELTHAIENGKTKASELETLQAAYARLEMARRTISGNLENKVAQNNAMTKKIDKLGGEITKLAETNGKSEKQVENLALKKAALVEERDTALQELVTAQTEIGTRNHAISSLTNQLEASRLEMQSAIEAFEIKTRHREGEVLNLKSTVDGADEQNRQLKEKLDAARLETSELKTRISSETDKRFELEKRCAEFGEKNSEYEKHLEASQSSFDALNARYLLTKSELEKQLAANKDRRPLDKAPSMFFAPTEDDEEKKPAKKQGNPVKKKLKA